MIFSRADGGLRFDSTNLITVAAYINCLDVVQQGNAGVRMALGSIVELIGVVECASCDPFHKKIDP